MPELIEQEIHTADELIEQVENLGFIPFFRNKIKGFSIQEMADPSLWFVDGVDGPWEWKGPAIRSGRVAYGKFFRGKTGYISLKWLPYFISYRRNKYPLLSMADEIAGLSQRNLLETIAVNESLVSNELKELLGFAPTKKRTAIDLVDISGVTHFNKFRGMSTRIDKMLADLQMQLRITIADFEYLTSKTGKPYGWGLARYTTPESLYGSEIEEAASQLDPSEAFTAIRSHVRSLFPLINKGEITLLLK